MVRGGWGRVGSNGLYTSNTHVFKVFWPILWLVFAVLV
jgi:hypothetical protein